MGQKVLVVVDIQKEVATAGRPYFIQDGAASMVQAKKVLEHARKNGWPVYHVRHLQDGDLFGHNSPLSAFVEGFEPLLGEKVFTKGNYSCFSSPEFKQALESHVSDEIFVVGYGTTKCVLATIVDGYHQGYQFTLVTDATGAIATEVDSSQSMHKYASQILTSFSRAVTAQELTTI